MTTGQPTWEIWGNATGASTNFESVAQNPASGPGPAGDNGSINSSTSGNEDLYGYPALAATATTVYTVGVKALVKKSDAGVRTIDLRVKSSSSDTAGNYSGLSPGTTYSWLDTYVDRDPNGPTNWTVSTANSAVAGVKVAS
jgi:hypothetical protein